MTTQRLRDLLEERVADVEAGDLSAGAWARADGVRRRRRFVAVGTAAAAVLVVAGGVAVLDDRQPTNAPPVGRPTSTPSSETTTTTRQDPQAELAGKFRGAPFWWAPSAEHDPELRVLQVPGLPDRLSMSDDAPVSTPPDHVVAVFGTGKQQYRLLTDDRLVSVDLSDRLGPVGDESGNMFNPLGRQGLSPDGTQVIFRQPGRVEIWNLPTNTWRTVETADYESAAWTRDGELWLPGQGDDGRPDPWDRGDQQYSQVVVGPGGLAAELDWTVDAEVPGAGDPGHYANPEFLAAGTAAHPSLLAVSVDGRGKICCSPIGWFSHEFVLFEASSTDGQQVLAWRVGTPGLYRVSAYVEVPRPFAVSSWAEDAFSSFGQ